MGLLRENVCAKLCKKVKADKGARINLWNKCGGEVTGLKKKKKSKGKEHRKGY